MNCGTAPFSKDRKKTEKNEQVTTNSTAIDNRASADLIAAIEFSSTGTPHHAAEALAFVRDEIIAGGGPTTKGRVHFSRELDATDAAWCKRILTAPALARGVRCAF